MLRLFSNNVKIWSYLDYHRNLQIADILKIVKYVCFLRLTSSQKMSFYGPFEGFPVTY